MAVDDSGDLVYGALSYSLLRELNDAEAGSTYRDVSERVALEVTEQFPDQHPQLEGARDRLLFRLDELEPMRFVPVRQRRGDRLVLGGG